MAPTPTCLCGVCRKCKRREYMRQWYRRADNAARQCESQRQSRVSRIEKVREYDRTRGHRSSAIEKERARGALQRAITAGLIVRGVCEFSGGGSCSGRVEGHHDDYSKPLEVRWLCRLHHGVVHRRVGV